jgi:hypothetical protein
MRIRNKNVEGNTLVVQYIYGTTNPHLGVVFIQTVSSAEAAALGSSPDEQLVKRVKQEIGEEMLADLQATYG